MPSFPMQTLIIRHFEGSTPAQFQVVRPTDGKSTEGISVPPPVGYAVAGRPDSDLIRELRWYLERFLDYPFPPETDHAERVLSALQHWGEAAFSALFGSMQARDWFKAATAKGHEQLHLQISSDDPRVLAWPWEALRDPETDYLALGCQIERKLNQIADPVAISDRLPTDRVNILLVTARPYEADVRYRSISRPLVELIEKEKLPAHVTVLRPPTFDNLRAHLHAQPDTYHLLHFDGHGGYGEQPTGTAAPFMLQGPRGVLVFEKADGKPDEVPAEVLSTLLREHRIPAVVLNACQSATIDERAEDAFASVAAALVKAGVRSVVAMAYSLYVSGAQQFLPAFYRRLFDEGDAARATRGGRQQMYAESERICARGTYPLSDWLVPVVYQQAPISFSFAAQRQPAELKAPTLPEEARDTENPYGFIGRDGAVLQMERAMHRAPAGILVHGLGGAGKTTLARGFIQWLAQTDGLGKGCFWFTFNDIRSAEFVLNRMGEALFGADFIPAPVEQKLEPLVRALKENRFLIVWDNFESACGIDGTAVGAMLSSEDQQLLRRFLTQLRGGQSKVIITSRSEEDWLGPTNRFKLSLGGLQPEERWEYCEVILRDLGITIDRDDAQLVALMNALDGHPLMMRVLLPKLEDHSAGALLTALQTNLAALGFTGDATQEKLLATLRFVEEGLPAEVRSLLTPLALHEHFVDANYLETMAKRVDQQLTRAQIDRFFALLATAGLVRDRGQAIYELHPALTGYLRSAGPAAKARSPGEPWARAFVDVMGRLADDLAPRPLHEKRFSFHLHRANFHAALAAAERLAMDEHHAALIQSLAAYTQNTRDFASAERLFQRLADFWWTHNREDQQAAPYHQLGMVAQERRDFAAAEAWYRKSLDITEKLANESGAALTYHQLGRVAQERRDFAAAAVWYQKSLVIKEKSGNERGAASTYHQLGRVAELQRDFAAAEAWYRKSLAIEEKLNNEPGAAATYHQLGVVAEERGDFAAAEAWYRKSLDITEELGDAHGAARTYHQLGMVALERSDFAAAEAWYRKSLDTKERLGNEHGAAISYHQLGMVAAERGDFAAAEAWYRKSLDIKEKLGDEHGAASTYGQLGLLAGLQERYEEAGQWLFKGLVTFANQNDSAGMEQAAGIFRALHARAPSAEKAILEAMWSDAKLGAFAGEGS